MEKQKYGHLVKRHPIVQLPHPTDENGEDYKSIEIVGNKDFNSDFSMVCLPIIEPVLLEAGPPHRHDHDIYLTFMGLGQNCLEDLGAELVIHFGEEQEAHVITSPSSIYIPKGLLHCPLEFTRVDKPMLLILSTLASEYEKKD